jgi:hypothetical protein
MVSCCEQILRRIGVNIAGMMKKKSNNSRESARTTIASIKREMQKLRLTESVRNDGRDQVVPVAKQTPTPPVRVRGSGHPSA